MKTILNCALALTTTISLLSASWILPGRDDPIQNDPFNYALVAGAQETKHPIPGSLESSSTFQVIGEYPSYGYPNQLIAGRNRLYIAEGVNGVEIVDVIDPSSPKLLGTIPLPANAMDVSGNIAYLADGTLRIVDAGNPKAYALLGSLEGQSIDTVQVQGQFAYSWDNLPEGEFEFKVIDVSDSGQPYLRGHSTEYDEGSNYKVGRKYAYVSALGIMSPLYMFDISNPDQISATSSGIPYSSGGAVDAENDVVYFDVNTCPEGHPCYDSLVIGEMNESLHYFEPLCFYDITSPITALVVSGESLYLYSSDQKLTLLSVKDPNTVYEVYSQNMGWDVHDMQVVGNLIYLATTDGVKILRYGLPLPEYYLPMLKTN